MRSIHSILDRTDQKHLKEIILVDDYSDIEDLHDNVQKAVNAINNQMRKEDEMLETNNIDVDNIVDYINDDNNNIDKKSTEKDSEKNLKHSLNVRLLRTSKREGLIRARLYGADNSVGEVSLILNNGIINDISVILLALLFICKFILLIFLFSHVSLTMHSHIFDNLM